MRDITQSTKSREAQEMIDITAEVQKLRLHYDQLVETKERREILKRKKAETPPSKRSIDLYEMGKTKLLYERAITEAQRQQEERWGNPLEQAALGGRDTAPSTPPGSRGSSRGCSLYGTSGDGSRVPIEIHTLSICNRLYDEGMAKVMAEKMAEEAKREEEEARELYSRMKIQNPSPIPICDRLYEQGMTKVMAEKMAEIKKWEEEQSVDSRRENDNPAPIPVCDRLYKEGMKKKIGSTEYEEMEKKTRMSQNPLLPSPGHFPQELQ